MKVFAYLILLMDPQPPFICIEEPENGLYHRLLEILAEEFRAHATGGRNAPQIFVTTHQPYFVDALKPDEAWILEKQADGFAKISRASDNDVVRAIAVHPGGTGRLKKAGYPTVGQAKCEWAGQIAPHMDVNGNRSPSFRVFRDGVRNLAGI